MNVVSWLQTNVSIILKVAGNIQTQLWQFVTFQEQFPWQWIGLMCVQAEWLLTVAYCSLVDKSSKLSEHLLFKLRTTSYISVLWRMHDTNYDSFLLGMHQIA